MEFKHLSVMLDECIEGLNLKPNGTYFDGTLGGGGHSLKILEKITPDGFLFATDLDDEAISFATERLSKYKNSFKAVKSNFKNFKSVAESLNVNEIDGAILDLGVSSYQLDNKERGFSYMAKETLLDMRMDGKSSFSAYDVVNSYEEKQLKFILSAYGEERFAGNIARNIVETRKIKPIKTTGELVEICEKSIPNKFKKDGHPAKRTFQAIRIEVNGELTGLDTVLRDIVDKLKSGGRLAVITFHSLEDRIVKTVFKDLSSGCNCDKRFPCVCGKKEVVKEVNKKPITASENELSINSRAKCAKLRIIEKL
ncbi:MAG: 16S rRNA (cytosine(1402)-N(4))-methyltransferase RsmH [Clostridia bacterium]|nr:16S rRNA (cytosine(1402)-N(4))-methyltransferase RsmH [Clostridia bacterium]